MSCMYACFIYPERPEDIWLLKTHSIQTRQSLGEMSTLIPVSGSFTEYAERFIDDSLAFALGWAYWYLWVTVLANEYNSISLVIGYWTDAVPQWGWILIFWVLFLGLSNLGIMAYGEMEFWLSLYVCSMVFAGRQLAEFCSTSESKCWHLSFSLFSLFALPLEESGRDPLDSDIGIILERLRIPSMVLLGRLLLQGHSMRGRRCMFSSEFDEGVC